jgi:glucose-6-phosphate 1-dehydrogenase
VLRAVRSRDDRVNASDTVRGRYTAGAIDGRPLLDYTAEPDVVPTRQSETFAHVMLSVDNDRWRGVPFRLRTGKALGRDRREIRVRFRPVSRLPFGQPDEPGPNALSP